MSSSWPGSGLNSVAAYQVSGIPFVTSSNGAEVGATTPVKVEFPRVTRWIEITPFSNSGANYLKLGFTSNGVLSRGAVTASVGTGFYDTDGNEDHVTVKPTPNAYEQSATARNFLVIPATSTTPTIRLEVACTEIFLLTDSSTCGFSVMAGLTGISRRELTLTGSVGDYGVG